MKKSFLFTNLLFLCLVLGFSAHATDVGGLILEDTTWTKAGSPYVVISHVTVIEDVTLTIEPDVEVKFDEDKALLIDGTIIARGTSDDKIIFTSNGAQEPGYWGFISFSDTSTDATFDPDGNYTGGCILQHTTIQYGGSGQPVIKISLSSPFIDNSLISQNAGNGISITKGSPVISNSEIKNHSGSGVYSDGDAGTTLTIDNCIISNNSNRGIYASSGTITVQNSTISGNSVDGLGGGIYASDTLTVQNSTISGNHANANGGGIYASGTLTVSDSNISNNFTDYYYGGGIYLDSGTLTIQNSTISGNSGPERGGGIYASGTLTIQNSTISGNSVEHRGGGIYLLSGTLTIQNSTISENSADASGGGIYAYSSSTVTISDSTISGNSTTHGNGGGINASGTITIEGNTFTDNSANNSGGAINVSGTVTINNNVFNKDSTGNSAPVGGAIRASGTVVMQGNTIIQNTAADSFGGVVRLDVSADSIIGGDSCEYANLIKDNTGDGVYIKGNPAFNHNDVYNNTGFSLVCGNASGAPDIDATNNYWGTDSEAVVKAVIWDGLDDPALGLVNYNPFLTEPCKPTEPPTVTDVTPSSRGQGAENQDIVVTGTNFMFGADVSFSGDGITVNSTTFVSDTELTANIDIDPDAPVGLRDVIVTNPDEQTGTGEDMFEVTPAPTVTSTSPDSLLQGATEDVTIEGSGFVDNLPDDPNGPQLSADFGDGIAVNSVTFVSSTELIANISIADDAAVGARDVTVVNGDAGVGIGEDIFTVLYSISSPTVTNSTGASDVTATSARLNGEVTSTGGENPTVHIYWGDEDGETTAEDWDNDEDLGIKGLGAFYKDISGLTPNTTYYYRCYAENSAGDDWADSSAEFTTDAQSYYAVIAGVADYPGTGNDLRYPDDDARDIYNALLRYSNWEDDNIFLLIDSIAKKQYIEFAINTVGSLADENDVFLFFFSGHGTNGSDLAPIDETDGRDEYICSHGSNLNEYIRDDELSDWLGDLPTSNVSVIIDTCFSGGQIKIAGGTARYLPGTPEGLVAKDDGFASDLRKRFSTKDMDDNAGCVVLTACDDDELSTELPLIRNGVFSFVVVRGIQKNVDINANGELSAEEIYDYTQSKPIFLRVWNILAQHPQIHDDYPASNPSDGELALCIGEPSGLIADVHEDDVFLTMLTKKPVEANLYSNYPNPCNPDTWIPYQLKEASEVTISIYDVSGRLIRKLSLGQKDAGRYITKDKAAYWDGRNSAGERVSSGLYFYQLQAGEYRATKRMLILK